MYLSSCQLQREMKTTLALVVLAMASRGALATFDGFPPMGEYEYGELISGTSRVTARLPSSSAMGARTTPTTPTTPTRVVVAAELG